MNRSLISGLSLLAAIAVACNKKSDAAGTTTGAFITPATFTAATPTALTVDEVKTAINDEDNLYDNEPSSGSGTPPPSGDPSEADPMDTCMSENQPKLTVVGTETLSVAADVDLLTCFRAKLPPAGSGSIDNSSAFKIKFQVNFTCPGSDLTSLTGKTFADISDDNGSGLPSVLEDKCKNSASVKIFSNIEFNADLTLTDASGQKVRNSSKMTAAQFTKDGGACELVKTADGYTLNGCIDATLTVNEGPDPLTGNNVKKTNLTILEASNLVDLKATTAAWFNGGAFKATFNNFTGTITYTNSTTAPTYTMTAAGGLSASGTVEQSASSGSGSGSGSGSDSGSESETLSSPAVEVFAEGKRTQTVNPFANAAKYMKLASRRMTALVRPD
jgi:hypothetical protein